jgi:hypothetical protein
MASIVVPNTAHEGLTLLSSTTLSGAQTINVTGIPLNYRDLKIVIRNYTPATDGATLQFRFNGDSTASRHTLQSSSTADGASTFASSGPTITGAQDNSVTTGLVEMNMTDYANATTWKHAFFISSVVDSATTTSVRFNSGTIRYNQITPITSITIFASSGNINAGTLLLYGVN